MLIAATDLRIGLGVFMALRALDFAEYVDHYFDCTVSSVAGQGHAGFAMGGTHDRVPRRFTLVTCGLAVYSL